MKSSGENRKAILASRAESRGKAPLPIMQTLVMQTGADFESSFVIQPKEFSDGSATVIVEGRYIGTNRNTGKNLMRSSSGSSPTGAGWTLIRWVVSRRDEAISVKADPSRRRRPWSKLERTVPKRAHAPSERSSRTIQEQSQPSPEIYCA